MYSHNTIEQLYHPDNFKKKFCINILNGKKCKYGDYCALAHTEEEIRINLIHKLPRDKEFFM